jgi:hypothetical protein
LEHKIVSYSNKSSVRFPSSFGTGPDNALVPTVLVILEKKECKIDSSKHVYWKFVFEFEAIHVLHSSQFTKECWQWAGQAVFLKVPETIRSETNNVNHIYLTPSLGDSELYIKSDL